MSTLENIWNTLKPRKGEGIDFDNTVADSFLRPWNHDNANMDMMVQVIDIVKPSIVIELGTFEGWGMEQLALAMSKNGKGKLFTFDAGKAPMSLGEPYGVTKEYLIDGCLVDWENIKFEGWKVFGSVIEKRKERIERLKNQIPDVEITFVEGLTWNTLPVWMPDIGTWDFLFQDSTHDLKEILVEWKLYAPYSKIGSIVVIDDANNSLVSYFRENMVEWKWFFSHIGHTQLWGERIS